MKQLHRLLIAIVLFLLASVIIFSVKIVDYPSLGNLLVSKIGGKPVCKDCNVILISLDTLSANHLPCYGYARNTAPNLCKFGKENTLFTNMFSNANYTLPSHVSIFTGLYPNKHKVYTPNLDRLSPTLPFLPEILQGNGYKTHLYLPLIDTSHFPVDKVYYRGIDKIASGDTQDGWDKGLHSLKKNNEKNQKTFLFLHTYWVHSPYFLQNKERKLFTEGDRKFDVPETYEQSRTCSPSFLAYLKKALELDFKIDYYAANVSLANQYRRLLEALKEGDGEQYCNAEKDHALLTGYFDAFYEDSVNTSDPESMDHQRNLYDSKIVELDERLKDVFAYVQNSDLKKNTIIIVTSDHGEEFMEHGAWMHAQNLYDTSLKVPLMMYIPGQGKKEMSQLAESVDIVPTLLGLLKLKNPYKLSGVDLFIQNAFSTSQYAVAQHTDGIAVIRDSEWKLFYTKRNSKNGAIGTELYNYRADPMEKNNLLYKNVQIADILLKNLSE